MTFLEQWLNATWSVLLDSAAWLLFGLLAAGGVHLLLHSKNFGRFVRGNSKMSVFRAALLGVPLPLCSCSVLPVAQELRRSGVGRGPTAAFLISTPESGVDSIALTYSLTDPLLTVARPVTAFATAAAAGLVEATIPDHPEELTFPTVAVDSCCSDCGCDSVNGESRDVFSEKIRQVRRAIGDLLDDLSPHLLLGYLLAGVITAWIGPRAEGIPDVLLTGWGSYVGALVIGIPLYICATASTPMAAALLATGFAPGAILVFLMVGPATNVTSLVVLRQILKGWSLVRYLIAIVVVSVVAGLFVDLAYTWLDIAPNYLAGDHGDRAGWFAVVCAVVLSVLVVVYSIKWLTRKLC